MRSCIALRIYHAAVCLLALPYYSERWKCYGDAVLAIMLGSGLELTRPPLPIFEPPNASESELKISS